MVITLNGNPVFNANPIFNVNLAIPCGVATRAGQSSTPPPLHSRIDPPRAPLNSHTGAALAGELDGVVRAPGGQLVGWNQGGQGADAGRLGDAPGFGLWWLM
jgi:hypothetical protein